MANKTKKEETVPFATTIKRTVKDALVGFCDREGIVIYRFIEDAVINELERRRKSK